jgi:hypothetical protein
MNPGLPSLLSSSHSFPLFFSFLSQNSLDRNSSSSNKLTLFSCFDLWFKGLRRLIMSFLKSYIHPIGGKNAGGKNKSSAAVTKPVEMTLTPPVLPLSPARSSFTSSRPVSAYPEGDFRNTPKENILDIKCDVMVSWLHQQQLERLWGNGGHGEGVVLKKSRERYTACPDFLKRERGGFFDQIVALNVKVCMPQFLWRARGV